MSRRSLVILVLLLGALVVVFLFVKKDAAVAPSESSAENNPEASTSSVNNESSAGKERSAASSVLNETTSSSSSTDRNSGHIGRGPRSPHREERSHVDTSGAQALANDFLTGSAWRIWSGITAAPKANGEPAGRVVGELNGYYLFENGFVADTEQFHLGQPIVVINPTNDTAGVLTGTFTVVLEEGASADFLQAPHIKTIAAFPEISTYYVTSAQSPFDLKSFQEALRAEPEVKQVTPEILSRKYEKF